MPAITQASVVGIKDERYGEVVGAFVDVRKGNDITKADVRAWVQETMAKFKTPKYIFWMGQDGVPQDFPCTASGKIRKIELRALANDLVERGLVKE
jgi:acyl-CoA synthetase (AMP-forming)/AMP-acid ligase II